MQRVRLLVSLIAIATVTIVAAQPPTAPAPRDPQRELLMNVGDGFTLAAVGDNIIAHM